MQMIQIPKNGECTRIKNYKNKIKARFMIYTDFENILVPEDNGNQKFTVLCKQISKTCCLELWLVNLLCHP